MNTFFYKFWISIVMVCISSTASAYFEVDGMFYSIISTTELTCEVVGGPDGFEYTGDVTIPSFVSHDDKIYSVTEIGSYAFYGSSTLKSVTIPNSVIKINDWAFSHSSLLSILIPNSVTSIGYGAFSECHAIESITIPDSVTEIDRIAFNECTSLAEISVAQDNPNFCSIDGVLFNKDTSILISFPNAKCQEYIMPNSVKKVEEYAFFRCTSLTSVTLSDSLIEIGETAFRACTSLTSVAMANSIKIIGEAAFQECSSLTALAIPESVTEIGNAAFLECSSLTSMTIPDQVTKIQSSTFGYCTALSGVTIPESITEIGDGAFRCCYSLKSMTIPNSVTIIGDGAFYSCNSLESVIIGNSVTGIGESAFWDCNSLTSVTIPTSVTNIKYSTFAYCRSLTSISLPATLTEIEQYAFLDCNNLTSAYYNCENPIESNSYGIFKGSLEKATLYVPEAAIEKCKIISPWKEFKNIEAYEFSGVESVMTDAVKAIVGNFDATGSPVDEYYRGIVITKYSDGSTKKNLQR